MTRPVAETSPRQRLPRIPQVRLPHPSWRLSGARQGTEIPLSADDFWKRLGV